jgi:hypothetical protein
MRNFHQAFDGGLWTALPRTGFQMYMGGLDPLGGHLKAMRVTSACRNCATSTRTGSRPR